MNFADAARDISFIIQPVCFAFAKPFQFVSESFDPLFQPVRRAGVLLSKDNKRDDREREHSYRCRNRRRYHYAETSKKEACDQGSSFDLPKFEESFLVMEDHKEKKYEDGAGEDVHDVHGIVDEVEFCEYGRVCEMNDRAKPEKSDNESEDSPAEEEREYLAGVHKKPPSKFLIVEDPTHTYFTYLLFGVKVKKV